MRSFLTLVFLSFAISGSDLQAQPALALPGCEASPEVRKAMEEQLGEKKLEQMKFPDRWIYQRKVLEDLIAKYPRELGPYENLSGLMQFESPDEFSSLRDSRVKMAKDHPDDPLALLLAGEALSSHDTPEAIRLLEAARSKAPQFPWPSLRLAGIYFSGKRADKAKVSENLETYFSLCPGSTNDAAQFYLTKDPLLQPKVAAALRARLESETDPKVLREYETVWGLEFRTRPPSEHDAVRAQVAQDLKRLETLQPNGDAEWQSVLIRGYKQSGASKETIAALEDKLIREYPHSSAASRLVQDRWSADHKKPEEQTDAAGWKKYEMEYEAALRGWIGEFTEDTYLQRYAWFDAIGDDDWLQERDGIAALDSWLKAVDDYEYPNNRQWRYESAAQTLLEHHWQPERALRLLQAAQEPIEKALRRRLDSDNLSDEQIKEAKDNQVYEEQAWTGLLLKAALQAHAPEAAVKLEAQINAPAPTEKNMLSDYWWNRARFEMLRGHKQDALAYYQLALQTRLEAPKAYSGKVTDDLTDEAKALWKAQGGSDAVWAVWSKPATTDAAQLAGEGRWEKPTKSIPEFELSDLSGKTWRLKELGGKTVLINLWATWCGPCQAELPHLEKFYEKVKDRSDIQVLTFDLDEDLGLVAPYLKEKGYTFPVLPAYSTVVSLLDGFAIPQMWLVDSHGAWRWKQIGFGGGSEADFEKEMLDRLDATKNGGQ